MGLNLDFLGITIARPANEELVALLLLPLLLVLFPLLLLELLELLTGVLLLLEWLLSAVLCPLEKGEEELREAASPVRAFFGINCDEDDDDEDATFFGIPDV